jgi:predicted Zn finger-like uncharacterized protein
MQIVCEKCDARYNLADDKIKTTGTAVRCPKCAHVFKVFAPQGNAPVACANCGKDTPAVEGMAVVFCESCRRQLADPDSGGGSDTPYDEPAASSAPAAQDPFAGMSDAFGDSASEGASDPDGGLFGESPSAPASGGQFDDFDAPAPSAASDPFADDDHGAGGLFDDSPPAGGGGLFEDDAPAGDGLFNQSAAAGGAEADPFAEFDAPPVTAPGREADPFDDLSGNPDADDDFGFAEAPPKPQGTMYDDGGRNAAAEAAPVREKVAPQFKTKNDSPKERILDFVADKGAIVGSIGGGAIVVITISLTLAMAFAPGLFDARPTQVGQTPGLLSRTSFGLQKMMTTAYYGRVMEESYLEASAGHMAALSGRGFANAEKELQQLLRFDGSNQKAKAALAQLYATWDLLEESRSHANQLTPLVAGGNLPAETRARAALALGKPAEIAQLLPSLGEKAPLYAAMASHASGQVTTAVGALERAASAPNKDFIALMAYAAALRDFKRYPEAVSAYEAAGSLVGGNAKAMLEVGRLYYEMGNVERAMEVLNQSLADRLGAAPRLQAEAKYYLAKLLHRRGRGPEAIASIQSSLSITSGEPRYLTQLGNIHFDSGKIIDALQNYDRAKASDPKFVAAHIGLGRANERLGKHPEALAHYQQAMAINPLHPEANFLYAAAILAAGQTVEAEKVLRRLVEQEPINVEAVEKLAQFYMDVGRVNESLSLYGKAIERAPGMTELYVGRGVVLMKLGRLAEAKGMFARAAALSPENPGVLFRLGQAAFRERDYSTAEKSLRLALERDPYHAEAHLYLGMTLATLNSFVEAHSAYQRALSVDARASEVYRQRGHLYMQQASASAAEKEAETLRNNAVREFEQAIYYKNDDADYHYDYGVALDSVGKAGKARDAWLKAKELRPEYKEAMFKLARYYVSFTDYRAAETILKEVLAKSPNDPQAHLEMGRVFFATNRLGEAKAYLTKAMRLDTRNADGYALLGEVHEREGRFLEATRFFEQALKVDPKHGISQLHLGLYYKDRDPKKARELFQRAINTRSLPREKVEEAQLLIRELDYLKP